LENHVEGMESLSSFSEVFSRYTEPYLQWYWQVPMAAFAFLSFFTVIKNRKRELALIIVPALSFFFFVTFTVSSLHPLKMAEPFINRYFSAVLPAMFFVICFYIDVLINNSFRVRIPEKLFMSLTISGMGVFVILFSIPAIPSKIKEYVRPPFATDHPFKLNDEYRRTINDAWIKNRSMVSTASIAGRNANESAGCYYLDISHYIDGVAPETTAVTVDTEFSSVRLFTLGGRVPSSGETVLNVIRNPFRIQEIPFTKLAVLRNEAFPE